jgi:hypothetical protein
MLPVGNDQFAISEVFNGVIICPGRGPAHPGRDNHHQDNRDDESSRGNDAVDIEVTSEETYKTHLLLIGRKADVTAPN